LADEQRGREPRVRISSRLTPHSFADIIFGLALSIGSLVLTQSKVQVWQDFAWNIVLFGFSFLIIALTWLLYSRTMSVVPSEVPSVLFLNLVLLFCVALEPYLFYMLMNGAAQNLLSFTSVGYALDVGFMFVVLAALASYVLKPKRVGGEDQRKRLQPNVLQSFRHMMIAEYIAGALFLVSAAPIFWVPTQVGHARFVLWYSSFLIFLISHFSHWKNIRPEKGSVALVP
jgi:uncharacterized membrane protein